MIAISNSIEFDVADNALTYCPDSEAYVHSVEQDPPALQGSSPGPPVRRPGRQYQSDLAA